MKRGIANSASKDAPAHKVDEEKQDLKSLLSDEQCAELIHLSVGIIKQMREAVELNFDASATLNKIGQETNNEDAFATLDFDPGTVDVGEYDKERKLRKEREKELAAPKVKEIKKAALQWLDDWRDIFLKRINETVNPENTAPKQQAKPEGAKGPSITEVRPVQTINTSARSGEYRPPKLEELFPRIPTSLTKLPIPRRVLVLHSMLLLLLSLEHYNAASRVFLLYLASSLKLGLKPLREDEEKTAQGLLQAAKQMSTDEGTLKKGKESKESRQWKIRLATAAGAAVVGLSGGFAAPMIAASVGTVMSEFGLGATAAAGYLGTVAGNTYVVGSLFGAYGGRMTGEMMRNLSAEVEDFAFLPVHGERKEHEDSVQAATGNRRLRVIIAITGWLLEKEEVVSPWRVLSPSAEVFALRFELEALMNLGQSIDTMVSSAAYAYAQSAVVKRTVFTELMNSMWPMALVKVARVVDNPFSVAKARADKAGKVLADALINRTQGERPVTLIGYSLGARVIWSCLTTLAEQKAFGLVESAVMAGAPIPSETSNWRLMRTAVSGRLVNVYSKNDYLLAFLYRTASLQYGVAGLMSISGLLGIENVDVSETVSGHLRYRYLMGSILQKIGFEDIDKDEVDKEAEAFKAMVEEEKKHSYVEQAKENAGELYNQYGKGFKKAPLKKISDAEANKQASAMEKEVQQKTQKGLMQWAVEQLYISAPSVPSISDAKSTASNPQGAATGAAKTANKTADAATKTLYQRAKEAVYISRSGGVEGQDTAKDKLAQAQGTAVSATPSSYLTTAAGYIPTGYIPGLGAAGNTKSTTGPAPKKLGQLPKKPSASMKDVQQKVGGAAKPGLKKTESAKGSVGSATNPATKRTASSSAQKKLGDATKDPTKTATDATGNVQKPTGDAVKNTAKKAPAAGGLTSYIPSFGYGTSSKQAETPAPKEIASNSDAKKSAEDNKLADAQKPAETEKPVEAEKPAKADKPERAGEPQNAEKLSADQPADADEDPDAKEAGDTEEPAKVEQAVTGDETAAEKESGSAKEEISDSQTPENKHVGSREDPFSDENPSKDSTPFQEKLKKAGEASKNDESPEKSEESGRSEETQKKASGYSSYLPSFGFGRFAAKSEEASKETTEQLQQVTEKSEEPELEGPSVD